MECFYKASIIQAFSAYQSILRDSREKRCNILPKPQNDALAIRVFRFHTAGIAVW